MRRLLSLLSACVLACSLASLPARAEVEPPPSLPVAAPRHDPPHVRKTRLGLADRPPRSAATDALRQDYDEPAAAPRHPRPSAKVTTKAAAVTCSAADFTSRSGSALVQQIKASTTDCINTLFSLTGGDASSAFREAQMTTVAYALRDNAASYPGDNTTSTAQLVLYLRAGYYAHWYHPTDVGGYGPSLTTAIQSGLDAFFAAGRAWTVSDANGEVLAEAVTLIDSAEQNARYLYVVKRLLDGYNSSYDASWWMLNAVNNVYTVLFRGHQVPAFVTAVQSDTSVLTTLRSFAVNHLSLLGTDRAYLTSNAGRELGRFLQHQPLLTTVRPQAKDLLGRSSITGATAPLWVGVAEMTDSYDKPNCAYYDTCDLQRRLAVSVLPINHTCSAGIRIRAQDMTSGQLSSTCASLANQDAYFHNLVKDSGPVAGDGNTTIEVVVFDSSTDYQTYAGPMFGIDTNNGGMYLEGDPSAPGNQPRFIAYEAEWLRPDFQIWNLNHEYTHYLDGRFDMYGDFDAGVSTPTIWWIEGFAEYVSYSYRRQDYDAAITEAGRRTYALSTLWDTTYAHDTTRVYRWGYLAVRYMFERHPGDVSTVLGHYRTGAWSAARSFLTGSIGSRYDTDWYTWLAACAAGSCAGGGGGTAPECTGTDTRQLDRGCRRGNLSAAQGDYAYLYLYLPAGVSRLTITAAGGTGNADLYYNPTGWATTGSYTQRSTTSGNAETLTVTGPPAGYVYISLYGAASFSGAAVTTEY
ncbi:M9 family metallopeptidase [Nonomuraea rhodomycinica]|uniref:M9 family metallopeptidase n=1 Tax=Nonomuraea rhodomycinica TaxID=1712872 RepID=UPI0028AAAEB5|nr:M9 family metallopeptidase [Nonomuraea rhodomycinica]